MKFFGTVTVLTVVLSNFLSWTTLITLLLVILSLVQWRFLRIIYVTFGRDFRAFIRLMKTQLFVYLIKRRNGTVPKVFKAVVNKMPDKIALYYNDEKWTFKELDEFSNKVANCFLEMGFQPGEEIALFMESKPAFVGIWLGLAKAGLIGALINTNQRKETLAHSITVVNCKAIIFGSELEHAIQEVVSILNEKCPIKYFIYGASTEEIPCRSLKELLSESSTEDPLTINKGNFSDRLFYVFTSGTTGLPKAAIIKHNRYIFFGTGLRNLLKLRKDDIIYTALPLYHQAGGTLGTAQCVLFGNSMAIRSKFSASMFWNDCIKYKCTVAQYIGEICRYLLAQPPKSSDRQHQIRIMFGNGLRPKIWKEFSSRFNIQQIGEFYGSTEGNANVVNIDNKEGSCGFVSRIAPFVYPVSLIRVNEETGEPIRDEQGLCKRAKPYEVGEFVGKISQSDPSRTFDGYICKKATKKKIIRNVFKKGDEAFSSGDLLTMDEFGYLYFKDRTGDTFRWRGENVSTMEVEAVVSNHLKLTDCVVFGAEVPGCEGKAGMLVILNGNDKIDLNNLLENLQQVLPLYAIPVFIRLVSRLTMTSTFKLPKNELQRQGYDLTLVKDPLFILDSKRNQYVEFGNEIYQRLRSGELRI